MRDRIQLELSVAEYHDARRAERQRLAAQLHADLARAERDRPPWYEWVLNRANGIHDHAATRENGEPAACPVPGCRAGTGRMLRNGMLASEDPLPY